MKYALLLYDVDENWADVGEDEMSSLHEEYMAVANEPESYGGAQLQPKGTAKTLRLRDGELLVTDGPFAETKEVISGLYLVDADSEERALELAARIPTLSKMGGVIEVRPIVER
ncbi:MAG TPA: YciI family protein [Gaiellaceae bacterium]|nr:YciI family protein [Gaiellaceae bacterium]